MYLRRTNGSREGGETVFENVIVLRKHHHHTTEIKNIKLEFHEKYLHEISYVKSSRHPK